MEREMLSKYKFDLNALRYRLQSENSQAAACVDTLLKEMDKMTPSEKPFTDEMWEKEDTDWF